jgi:hypothetical protein
MTAKSPIHPVQTAIYQRLKADPVLAGMVTGVYDYVPEGTAYPYVRIGDHLSIPDNTHDTYGREITTTIHIWTRSRGNAQGQAIAARIGELLDHRPRDLAVAGHRVVSIRQEFDQVLPDPDPEVRHHIVRFRIQTEQE